LHVKWNQLQRSFFFFLMMVLNTIFEINSQATIHGAWCASLDHSMVHIPTPITSRNLHINDSFLIFFQLQMTHVTTNSFSHLGQFV
jgi:hypothetical protein